MRGITKPKVQNWTTSVWVTALIPPKVEYNITIVDANKRAYIESIPKK